MGRLKLTVLAKKLPHILAVFALLVSTTAASQALFSSKAAAACTTPNPSYGNVNFNLNIPATATYRIWTRIMVPDTSNNTVLLEVDGSCYNVGGTGIPALTWKWVDYYNANTNTKVQQNLSAGNRSIKLFGNKAGVKVDRVIAVSDLSCVPTSNGNNCNVPNNPTPPPSGGGGGGGGTPVNNGDFQAPSVPGNVKATATSYKSIAVTWSASTDNVGVTSYSIVRDGVPVVAVGKVTSFADDNLAANTTYTYQVIAIDGAGNKSAISAKASAKTQTVIDSQAPSKPGPLTATAVSSNQINLVWEKPSDNIGVTSYDIYRATNDGSTPVVIGTSKLNSYGDPNLTANTEYIYFVKAKDASGNTSQPSDSTRATTHSVTAQVVTSSVTGTITDTISRDYVPYASVVLEHGGNRHVYQADRFGRYAIFGLPAGDYSLIYRAKDYDSTTLHIKVTEMPLTQDATIRKQ